jgi:NAD(P)-dependent dehydrogenase (short-subunit alcohol dehydrogenase family)
MANLNGKTALVTGASREIGRAIAGRLARDGAHVAVHYGTREADARTVVESIVGNGGKAFAIATEFGMDGIEPEVDALFRDLDLTLGDGLDILVNNAGILDGTPIEQVTVDAFDRSFAVNVRAPFFVLQRALPRLREDGRICTYCRGRESKDSHAPGGAPAPGSRPTVAAGRRDHSAAASSDAPALGASAAAFGGVTNKTPPDTCGRCEKAAASSARSAIVSFGRATCRRKMSSSCRSTSGSTSFAARPRRLRTSAPSSARNPR